MPWDETDQYIRSGHMDPSLFQEDTFRTITLSEEKGIKAVIGKLKGEDTMTIQSFLFDKSKGWTMEKAKEWFKEHMEKKEEIKKEEITKKQEEEIKEQIITTKKEERKIGESFSWLKDIQILDNNMIKVVAINAGRSLNDNIYLKEELMKAARTFVGKPIFVGVNHEDKKEVGYVYWAEYEDGRVELIGKVDDETYEKIKKGEIKKASIEASYIKEDRIDGKVPRGIIFDGLLLLLPGAQPGDPLTDVSVLERLSSTPRPKAQEDLGGRLSMEEKGIVVEIKKPRVTLDKLTLKEVLEYGR